NFSQNPHFSPQIPNFPPPLPPNFPSYHSLLAGAQRRCLHVYDNQGLEIHVLRSFQNVLHLQFLPYHFLLAASSSLGLLHFLDVSVGREVATLRTRSGRAAAMAQNPASAVVHLGHANGTVSLWTPNAAEPAVRLLAHRGGVRGIAAAATLMATSGLDRKIRIFDLRTFGVLHEWGVPAGAARLHFSHRGLLAAACRDLLQIYPKPASAPPSGPFLQHRTPNPQIWGLQFCPFQDVLGAGHGRGFTSILVPGSGEPNADGLEQNPFRSRRQRQEWEVKALLEKVTKKTPNPPKLTPKIPSRHPNIPPDPPPKIPFFPSSKFPVFLLEIPNFPPNSHFSSSKFPIFPQKFPSFPQIPHFPPKIPFFPSKFPIFPPNSPFSPQIPNFLPNSQFSSLKFPIFPLKIPPFPPKFPISLFKIPNFPPNSLFSSLKFPIFPPKIPFFPPQNS
uniref:Uncharacterized protein n=1 Tax=Geospiza parvula TaxID=87175 RepID=A0A8C3ND08_GEOPR